MKTIQSVMVFIILTVLISCKLQLNESEVKTQILINHLGYQQNAPKKIVLHTAAEEMPVKFQIVDSKDNIVYESTFEKGGQIDSWSTGKAYAGYFTTLQTTGEYHAIVVLNSQVVKSEKFTISDNDIARQCIPLMVEGYHSQRCASPFDDKDRKMSFFGVRNDTVDVHGGWYDASGEKGKYLSHLCFTNYLNPQQTPMAVWNMLASADLYIKSIDNEDSSIVKSLQDEAIYGADFLVRMQDKEGYFYTIVFANWSSDAEKREICAYEGSDGKRTEDYRAAFREGGGMAIAALARISTSDLVGDYQPDVYLQTAIKGYEHLMKNNLKYVDDGKENIIDQYCALMAATELYGATKKIEYLEQARLHMNKLISYLKSDDKYENWWSADADGTRSFFHGSDAGLPLVALSRYLQFEEEIEYRNLAISTIQQSVKHELVITNQVNNPFGYARQYVKSPGQEKRARFFLPHQNESGYWWQGENARLASLASAFQLVKPYLDGNQQVKAQIYANDQVNWILGLNPYNVCMLDGIGRNNPDYREGGTSYNYKGGVCNGITGGFDNEKDLAFMPYPQNDDPSHSWRWSEQWIPHAAWLMLALASSAK